MKASHKPSFLNTMQETFNTGFAFYYNPYHNISYTGKIKSNDGSYLLLQQESGREEWVLKSYCKPSFGFKAAPKKTSELLSKLRKCSCGAIYAETDRYEYKCGGCQ